MRGTSHQIHAGDHVGHDGLRRQADDDARDAPDGQQRRDVDAQHVQRHQCARCDQQPTGECTNREHHPLQRVDLALCALRRTVLHVRLSSGFRSGIRAQ